MGWHFGVRLRDVWGHTHKAGGPRGSGAYRPGTQFAFKFRKVWVAKSVWRCSERSGRSGESTGSGGGSTRGQTPVFAIEPHAASDHEGRPPPAEPFVKHKQPTVKLFATPLKMKIVMTALQTELLQISVSDFNETSQEYKESKSKLGQLLCSNYT